MYKLLSIIGKDLRVAARDPASLILALLTPLALTLVMAFAFGSSDGGGLSNIPVVLVNHDSGQFGEFFIEAFQSVELADLLEPSVAEDEDAARALVDNDRAAAVVILPANLSRAILPAALEGGSIRPRDGETAAITLYANPTRVVSSGIIRAVIDEILLRFAVGRAGGQVSVQQLMAAGLLSESEAYRQGETIGRQAGEQALATEWVQINRRQAAAEAPASTSSSVRFFAPSMAVLFLMFTVSLGARSILAERDGGTLPRMLVSPTQAWQVLGGKVGAIFVTGFLQLAILYVANRLLLNLSWGPPAPVLALAAALALGATGYGVLIAAFSRSPGQAAQLGTGITLVFSVLAGNFLPRENYPAWLQTLGYVTPNAWGIEGFGRLVNGAEFADILPQIAGLLAMAALLFLAAMLLFRRQYQG